MSQDFRILSIAAAVLLVNAVSVTAAFADSAPTTPAPVTQSVPLPQDRDNAYAGNPASPNCYPDINHCASYASGNVTKTNPLQPEQPQQAQQPKKPQ